MRTPLQILTCSTALLLSSLSPSPALAADLITLSPQNYKDTAPPGRKTDAVFGDYVMRNDRLIAVIADPGVWPGRSGSRKSINTFEGRLIDLTTRQNPSDQLDLFDSVRSGPQLRASLQQRGRDGESKQELFPDEAEFYKLPGRQSVTAPQVSLTIPWQDDASQVTYTLQDGKPYLQITTTWRPETSKPSAKSKSTPNANENLRGTLLILDQTPITNKYIRAGISHAGKFQYAYKIASGQAYGVYTPDPDASFQKLPAPMEDNYVIASIATSAKTPPDTTTQWLIPGKDLFEVNANLAHALGQQLKPFTLTVATPAGPAPNITIDAYRQGSLIGTGLTDDKGLLQIQLPDLPGPIEFKASSGAGQTGSLTISPADSSTSTLTITPAALLAFRVAGPFTPGIPCKVQVLGIDPTPNPDFGPSPSEQTVANYIYSPNGQIRQPIAPGKYKVIISHGPEFNPSVIPSLDLQPIAAVPDTRPGSAYPLQRSVDTTGYVSVNFDNRTAASRNHSSSSATARVLNLLAEHIEFAVASDIDHVGNLQPGVDALGAQNFITVVPGIKFTWARKYAQRFHTLFPAPFVEGKQDAGIPQRPQHVMVRTWLTRLNLPAPYAILIDDPLGTRPLTYDTDGDSIPDISWGNDPIDIKNPVHLSPMSPKPAGQTHAQAWIDALKLGYRPFVYASSDDNDNLNANARVRTYVQADDSNPGKIDTAQVVKSIQAGRMFPTTGPFLTVSLTTDTTQAPVPTGSQTTSNSGRVTLHIQPQSNSSIALKRLDILVNGEIASTLTPSPSGGGQEWGPPSNEKNPTTPQPSSTSSTRDAGQGTRDDSSPPTQDARRRTLDVPLQLTKDSFIIVVLSGESPNPRHNPVTGQNPPDTRIHAAVSNPIWVDLNANGYLPSCPVPYLTKLVVGSLDNEGATIPLSPVTFNADPSVASGGPGQYIIPITNKTNKPASGKVQFLIRPAGAITFIDNPAKSIKAQIPQYQNKPRPVTAIPLKGNSIDFTLNPTQELFSLATVKLSPSRNPGGFYIYSPRQESPIQRTHYAEYFDIENYSLPWLPKITSLASASESLPNLPAPYALNALSDPTRKLADVALAASPAGLAFNLRLTPDAQAAIKQKPFTLTVYFSPSEKWEVRGFDPFFKQPQPTIILPITFAFDASGKPTITTPQNITSKPAVGLTDSWITGFIPADGLRIPLKKGTPFLTELKLSTPDQSATLFESPTPDTSITLYARITPQ
jgi:hypothetical protein